jgi:cation diffusion facilitator CzcD-associated flavoprotein CzcO
MWMCSGYYDHNKGYTPEWPGIQDFKGQVVHPQHWPQDLDYAGKHVVVIGSGATAATLIPSLADAVAHVTMLQRSPTFFSANPATGFNLLVFGGVPFSVDGKPVDFTSRVTYRSVRFRAFPTWATSRAISTRVGRCARTWPAT